MANKKTATTTSVYERNLKIIIWESILTSIGAGFCISTITVFWNSIGMNQTAIGFVQMMFTIVILCLDIPMGYIADRFNRKVLNVIGDIGGAVTFLFYGFAQNMYMAIIAESLLGVFMAMTNGVDQSFIKFNANKIDDKGDLLKIVNARINTFRYIAMLLVVLIGGFIAKYNLRLTVFLSFIPYFIGALLAFFIKDFNGKVEAKYKNPVKDLIINVKEIIKTPKVKTYLLSYIIGREITHSQIWILTPLLIMVGVPIEIVSLGWVINNIMQIVGGKIAEKMIHLKVSEKFAIPLLIEMMWIIILIVNTNVVTVWLFTLNGLVHGLVNGSLVTPLQEATKDELQTSVMSIASTGARLLYVPLVYFTNYLGNIKLQLALVGVAVVFIPMGLIVYKQLRRLEKNADVIINQE